MDDTFTFRLDQTLRAALNDAAASAHKRPADFVRDLIRERTAPPFSAAEIARQCQILNDAARVLGSDEAAVMEELDQLFESDPFGDEWKA